LEVRLPVLVPLHMPACNELSSRPLRLSRSK